MELMKRKNGITLVSLVITIVILIILATVSINAIFGESGLVGNAEDAKFRQEKAEAQERLELVLADAYTEKITTTEYTQEEFLNEHLEEFVYDQEPDAQIDVRDEQDIISLNGHTFELDRSVPKLGDWLGFDGKLLPAIRRIDVTSKTDTSATIQVTTARTESVAGIGYRYSIKKQNESDESYRQVTTKSENTNEFTGLENTGIYTIYTVKVELLQNGVVVSEKYKDILIGKLVQGVVRFEEGKWNNGKASVKIVTDEKGYTLQYQIVTGDVEVNNSNWIDTSSGTKIENLVHGQKVYGRLWNGIDESTPAEFWVQDTVNPVIKEIKAVEITETKIKVQVNATDLESGIAKVEYSKDAGENYIIGTSENALEYEFAELEESKEYTIKVRVTDKAKNISELSKNIITYETPKWDGQSNDKVEAIVSSDGIIVPVPHEFVASKVKGENTVSEGFVIYQGNVEVNNENVDESITSRNQFVWIPVKDYNTMYERVYEPIKLSGVTTTTNVYSKFRYVSEGKPGTTTYREPDLAIDYDMQSEYYSILGYTSAQEMTDKLVEEYKNIYESIKYYGGFYIGRYELTGSIENQDIVIYGKHIIFMI